MILFFAFGFTATADAATDSVQINVEVLFCNADLICDPEENDVSCPSDCDAPVATSTPTTTPQTGGSSGGRSPGTRRPPYGATTTPTYPPTVIDDGSPGSGGISSDPTATPIDNIFTSTFGATVDDVRGGVLFEWESDNIIRILRGDGTFPTSPFDGGIVVYEGDSGVFIDDNLAPGTYYYTLFVGHADGTYSDRQFVIVHVVEKPVFATSTDPGLIGSKLTFLDLLAILILSAIIVILGRLYTRIIVR